jgi:protein involved in temperature-dependent protein secretion
LLKVEKMTERERRRRVIELLRSGSTSEAAGELAGSREVYPGDGALHHVIGMAFASEGTLRKALDELEAATGLDPGSAAILADLAQVRLARGETAAAAEAAEKAASISPDLAVARFTLGRAYFMAESVRQAKQHAPPLPGDRFPLIDGRATPYLRALEEMEAALDSAPPFVGAIRTALALAYQRAGHDHAALAQLRTQLAEPASQEATDQLHARIADLENEIIREQYWAGLEERGLPGVEDLREAGAEERMRLAHAYAGGGSEELARAALLEARRSGYEARECSVIRANGTTQLYVQFSDAHLLIAGGLECIVEAELRFLPFRAIHRVRFGRHEPWRPAEVELTSGEHLTALVPALYRHSVRSPNDLIQSGQFTQFSYGPGETRYAYAIGARSFISDAGAIAFSEIEGLAF